MKTSVKIFFILVAVILIANLCSCTENERAKNWGGTMTVDVEPGYEVMMATFKSDASMWYMVRKMADDYTPTDKILIEDSGWDIIHGKVIFHESRPAPTALNLLVDSLPDGAMFEVKWEDKQPNTNVKEVLKKPGYSVNSNV